MSYTLKFKIAFGNQKCALRNIKSALFLSEKTHQGFLFANQKNENQSKYKTIFRDRKFCGIFLVKFCEFLFYGKH